MRSMKKTVSGAATWRNIVTAASCATLTVAGVCGPARAQEEPAKEAGEGEEAQAPADVVQAVSSERLANGVTLMTQSIPGVAHTATLVVLRTGTDHDPADGPGLACLMDELYFGLPAGTGESAFEGMSRAAMRRAYGAGFMAQSHHDHAVYGVVTPAGEVDSAVGMLAKRAGGLRFEAEGIEAAEKALRGRMKDAFEENASQMLLNWATSLTFRNGSEAPGGVDVDALSGLTPERLNEEWNRRVTGSNVCVLVCGSLEHFDVERARDAWGALKGEGSAPAEMSVKSVGVSAKEVAVPRLPGGKEHAVAAYFAPAVSGADHPAFVAVAHQLMVEARRAAAGPGGEGNASLPLAFQYSMLSDDRAAYLTPLVGQFPKGAAQAMGYWVDTIQKLKFQKSDGKRAMRAYDWQFGAPLSGELVAGMRENPNLIFTIAYASAYRAVKGDEAFWTGYRESLGALTVSDLQAARDRYFTQRNWAFFLLKQK